MCGRFLSTSGPAELAEFFGAHPADADLGVNYNVAPTQDVYGVIADPQLERFLRVFEWGLIPSWSSDDRRRASLINARAETVRTKPAFRDSFAQRRCLLPMDGFYEWLPADPAVRGAKVPKLPVLIERADGTPLAVAGLWTAWRPKGAGEATTWRHTCTAITTEPNHELAAVHDRMPVILERHEWDIWLDPTNRDLGALEALLDPAPDDTLTVTRVSTEVNNARNRGPFERL